MAMVIHVTRVIPTGDGSRLIVGRLNFSSSYTAGGEPTNLSNYLSNVSTPTVIVESAGGYTFEHNGGTAAGGTVKAYQCIFNTTTVNSDAMNTPMYQVHSAKDLSAINAKFIAFGSGV